MWYFYRWIFEDNMRHLPDIGNFEDNKNCLIEKINFCKPVKIVRTELFLSALITHKQKLHQGNFCCVIVI